MCRLVHCVCFMDSVLKSMHVTNGTMCILGDH